MLSTLLKRGLARQFHQKIFSINQKASDLNAWQRIPQAPQLDIAYQAPVTTLKPIEEGRERHVTSYLRQWTQLIRLHGRGALKCDGTGKTIAARAV